MNRTDRPRALRDIAGLLLVFGVTGCLFGDPYRSYTVPGWKQTNDHGTRYERKVDPAVSVNVDNWGFGGSFGVTVDMFNISSEALSFDGAQTSIVDGEGNRLPSRIAGDLWCKYTPPPPVTVPPQGHLEARCSFAADLRKLPGDMTLILNGLSLRSRAISVTIPMKD
jgi:hypothetical protein